MTRPLFSLGITLWLVSLAAAQPAAAPAPWQTTIDAASYSNYQLVDPRGNAVVSSGSKLLQEIATRHSLGGQGWFEYNFTVPETGWYEVTIPRSGPVGDHHFFIDHDIHVYGGITDKISNAWLAQGSHTLRVQRLTWPGMAGFQKFAITRSGKDIASTVRIEVANDRMVFRKGEKLLLNVYSGGRDAAGQLTIWTKDAKTDAVLATQTIDLPKTPDLHKQQVAVPCDQEGIFYVSFGDQGNPIAPRDLRELQYVVIDTTPQPRPGGEIKKTLIREIDCAAEPPTQGFYFGGGDTRVVKTAFGSYRESGANGYLQHHHEPDTISFFAYDLDVDEPQRPYVIEVDYPDDAKRTFCIGLMEQNRMDYPPAGGVDSGGEFSLSHHMQTQTFIHWPRGKEQRILFFNAQSYGRAAVSKIRLYRVDGDLPGLNVPRNAGRDFGYWLEEGDRWATYQGAPDKSLGGYMISMKRWAEACAYMGADTVSPTLVIYQNALYPTQFYDGYNQPTGGPRDPMPLDVTRMLLLTCERYGLKMLPDFHPTYNGYKRQMVDNFKFAQSPDPKPNLLVARDGKVGEGPFRPYFNPIYPDNRDWYVGMIGEFTDRYKDSPALMGVDLRIMSWVWETHNGFPSIFWGYEDYTVDLFEKETGVHVPVDETDPDRFRKRYEFLTTQAYDQWVQWRCDKITGLYKQIRDRVQQSRPGLKVCSMFHSPQLDVGYYLGADFSNKADKVGYDTLLRESGYDLKALGQLDGVCFLNAYYYYGRRQGDEFSEQVGRDYLLSPEAMGSLVPPTGLVGYLFPNSYFEANSVVDPTKMGLPGAKPGGFVGVANPAGRHYLERYALAMADSDPSLLLDGGEGYILGQAQYLHEFLSEYRNLPPVRFTPRPDATDPVAVWELKRPSQFLFYAVNRERFPVEVDLKIEGADKIARLSTGEEIPVNNGTVHLSLLSYQLSAFRAPGGASITSVHTTVPPDALQQVTEMVQWVQKLALDVDDNAPGTESVTGAREMIDNFSAQAAQALAQGHVWSARTLLENHRLINIYKRMNSYPPHLRDNGEGYDSASNTP